MRKVSDVIECLRDIVGQEDLLAAFAEADAEGLNYIILNFKVPNLRYVQGFNIIMYYLPGQDLITWTKLEVLVSSDLPARDFMTKIYNELLSLGAEVVVRRDGISVFRKLENFNIGTEIINFLSQVIKIVEGIDLPEEILGTKLVFSRHMVL